MIEYTFCEKCVAACASIMLECFVLINVRRNEDPCDVISFQSLLHSSNIYGKSVSV